MRTETMQKIAETMNEDFLIAEIGNQFCVYRKMKLKREKPKTFIVASTRKDAAIRTEVELRKEKHTFINYMQLLPRANIINTKEQGQWKTQIT